MDNIVDYTTDKGNTSATRSMTPEQQGRQHQHNEGHDFSTKKKRMMMQV
jgi:hypothetical protein